MQRSYLLLLSLLIISSITFVACSKKQTSVSSYQHYSELIDSLLSTSYERGLFNGGVVVAKDGSIINSSLYGFSGGDQNEELRKDHLFSIGSMAKSVHVVSILMLVEGGKISLDDPLSKYMPELPSWSEKITINNLLNYVSGLPQLRFRDVKQEEDVIRHLQELDSLNAVPGSTYLYNHNSPIIFKSIVEGVTKISFEEFVVRKVLPKAKIARSKFDPKSDDPDLVVSFNHKGVNDETYNPFSGWLYMTVEDANKWISALVNGKLISSHNFEKFINNQHIDDTGTSLGKGIFNDGILERYEMRGGYFNFRSEAQYNFVSKTTITILDNNGGRYVGRIAAAIDSITLDKSFHIPKQSIYWAVRDSANLDADGIINYYNKLNAAHPDIYNFDDSDALYFLGRRLYRNEEFEGAIKILEMNLSKFPKHIETIELLEEIEK